MCSELLEPALCRGVANSTMKRYSIAIERLLPTFALRLLPTPSSVVIGLTVALLFAPIVDADVFDGPPLAYGMVLYSVDPNGSEEFRHFQVEERLGLARNADLVRIPVFFGDGECRDLDALGIVRENGKPVSWQADDIRRAPDGGISRVHLWIQVDLAAGETQRYRIVRRTNASAKPAIPAVEVLANEKVITVNTERGAAVWGREGQLLALPGFNEQRLFGAVGAFPRAAISYPAKGDLPASLVVFDAQSGPREVEWASGPLFAKIRVQISNPVGATLEQVYRIPRHGREVVITSALAPGNRAGSVVQENKLLVGTAAARPWQKADIIRVPAGVVSALRAEHAYVVTALKPVDGPGSVLAIPLVIGGPNGMWAVDDKGGFALLAQRNLSRGKDERDTLYAYGMEVRLVASEDSDSEALWARFREHVQPLVAVVEESGATVERLHAVLREVVREMKPIGWRQEAGRAWVMGDQTRVAKILQHGPSAKELDREVLLRSARANTAKMTNNGQRKLRDDEKGRAYGAMDPYHVTYTQSAAAALAVLTDAPETVTAVNHAMAGALREQGGLVDPEGNPYIDCFSRALNMQVGPVLFGLTAAARQQDAGLVSFYRDLATAPPVQAVFGRAQRPYTGAIARGSDQTDYLYQAICDFWLRTSEILANEDLGVHPLAYARYTDCIDVTADLYHAVAATDKPETGGAARANFFRGQGHLHRWLGWSSSPFIRLLEDPARHGSAGLTAAIHHAEALKGRWKNWPDLTFYILTDMLVREGLARYQRPDRLLAPQAIVARSVQSGTDLSWLSVEGAAEYRVYRADSPRGPYRWLNSPYLASPSPKLTSPKFRDEAAKPGATYLVTSVDASGRASDWPDPVSP